VPPAAFGGGGERRAVGRQVVDQVTAYQGGRLDPLRPHRGDAGGGPAAPVVAGEHRLVDVQGVHQRDEIGRGGGLLAVADGVLGQERRAAVAAQVGHDDP